MTHAEFKALSKSEHDLFISKLLYATKSNASCYSYATITMRVKRIELPFEKFIELPKPEQGALISTMLQNINQNESDFLYAEDIVEAAQSTNLFKDVVFGEHPAPEMIGANPLS